MEKGKALYVSSLFCSFVSLLRYIKINQINYLFPQYPKTVDKINLQFNENIFEFKTGTVYIDFLDTIDSVYKHKKWFSEFVNSMLLTDYHNTNNVNVDISFSKEEDDDEYY